jgi:cytohesin
LHAAAQLGKKDLAELLLAKGADVNAETDVNAANSRAWTPLDMAVFCKHKNVAKLLRQRGAHSNAYPDSMMILSQPLHNGDVLAGAGGDNGIQIPGAKCYIDDVIDKFGEINDAARNGDLAKVKALLKDHPDLVSSTDDNGQTPLCSAAIGGHKDVAELLLANKADVNAKDDNGETPLHAAAKAGQNNMVDLLRGNGGHE